MISDSSGRQARRGKFERTAAAVYEPLLRFARRRASPDLADDVVADTLLVLWRRFDEVVDETELAWCYGVARRCLANHHRSELRRRRLDDRVRSTTRHRWFRPPRTRSWAAIPTFSLL